MLIDAYNAVRARVDEACARAGRPPEAVKLLAVSKTKPAEDIAELCAAGVTAFAENKVGELCGKQDILTDEGLEWHLIGHLQSNKIKYLARRPVALIHSVDSLHLLDELQKAGEKFGRVWPILIEVNIGREESKTGCDPNDTRLLAEEALKRPNLALQGLMCVAPAVNDPEEARPFFAALRVLRDEIAQFAPDCRELSMGMSGDFEVAVEEGATLVRVGSLIFGARDYSKQA